MDGGGEGRNKVLIEGDFNAGTGKEGGRIVEEEEGERKSKDGKCNRVGLRLCKFVKKMGWSILNGNVEGDEEGEWTYTGGRGNSMIDYVLGNEETRIKVER